MLTKDNYREYNAINYSLLSKLSFDPSQVKQENKETEAMSFGSLFDCLLTSSDEFDQKYIIADVKKPTAQLGEFLDIYLYLRRVDIPDEDTYKMAHEEMKARNPKLRDVVEKFVERLETEARPYLDFLEKSKGKTVITNDDFYLATQMQNALKTSLFTSKYFNMSFDWETEYQVPLIANIEGAYFKILVDMLLINHAKKEIIPVDIKTTSEYPNKFQSSVIKYNYLIQASLYWEVIQANYPDYVIKDFTFMVCSKVLPQKPYLWVADAAARDYGKYGGKRNGYNFKGWKRLAEELNWHEATGLWEYPKEVYDNDGINYIDYFSQ